MAIVLPDTLFTLIEPMERRSDWLISVIDELGLKNVDVIRARAEEVGEVFDIATARAVSALPKLLRMCIPLVRHGGEILALKGSKAAEEIEEAKRIQKKLGVESFKIEFAGARLLSEPTLVVRTKLV
jgi:16S rRNA (guanine527-N7)-methyltransferase